MSMFTDVRDFHVAFSLLVAEQPALPDDTMRQLRRTLLAEEVKEYLDSEIDRDLVNLARELVDICYIINGTKVAYGLADQTPALATFANDGRPEFHVTYSGIASITGFHRAYEAAEDNNDMAAISEALDALQEAVCTCATMYRIPLLRVFSEVHRANMDKLVDGKVVRRADGKIMKPPGWQAPLIEPILFPVSNA